jgi:uroporphyrinogen III methyltransferase/synthase
VIAPAIAIGPPDSWTIADAALRRVGTYEWIVFTSANAVRALTDRASELGIPAWELYDCRLAAVGPATAAATQAALRRPDFVSTTHAAESLGVELPDVEQARVLFPCGDLAAGALPRALRERGAFVDDVVVYKTVAGPGIDEIAARMRDRTVDALLFASGSAVRFVTAAATAPASEWPPAICVGPVTAQAARDAGFLDVVVADGTTQDDLIDRAAWWFTRGSAEPHEKSHGNTLDFGYRTATHAPSTAPADPRAP